MYAFFGTSSGTATARRRKRAFRLALDKMRRVSKKFALDAKGNVTRAHYGKIYGDFEGVFWIYLNPEVNSRNIGADPRRALATNPEWKRMVRPWQRVLVFAKVAELW